ncbi:TPA: hypothetical protein ACXJLS_000265 [Stenotrophomonas maltophilia]
MQVNPDLSRALPEFPDVLAKLTDGTYTLHGGVIRHAAGTGRGGQIVGHLIFPGDALQTQQRLQELQSALSKGMNSIQTGMDGLQQSMNVLQGLQVANLAMTGLNLAVTTAGFVVVCKKLNKISAQIQEQSEGIARTLHLVGEVHERSLLNDEARFRSLLLSAQQFCGEGDTHQLRTLIPRFHEEYEFTKLILERHAPIGSSNLDRFGEIQLLQERLIHLGLGLTHVQLKSGSPDYGKASLVNLAETVSALNAKRIEAMLGSEVATQVRKSDFSEITSFLKSGKEMVPALAYQADVIDLESRHPGLLQQAAESPEIKLVAA